MSLQSTPGTVTGEHVLLTGPVKGSVTKQDGSEVDVTSGVILVSSVEEAEEVSFLIGERYVAEGHPDDIERDENGNLIQRPFEHKFDKKFEKHPGRYKGKPAGTPRKA